MSYIDEIMSFNREFVETKQFEAYKTTKYPNKKIAVLSCMDTRLTELLPAALNFKNGDIKIITNAGAIISHPFGSVMRSLLVAIYELGVEEIMVIGHLDCGMQSLQSEALIKKMHDRGIEKQKLNQIETQGIDLEKWLKGFDCVETSVMETVFIIRSHPLMPQDVQIHGLVIDPETGLLHMIEDEKKEELMRI